MSDELRPRSILNTFGQTVIVHHLVDRQIFHNKYVKAIDQAAAFLVRKVAASMGDPFMDSRHDLAALRPFWRALGRSRQLALRTLESLLIGAQELGAWHLFPCRKRREARQPDIKANRVPYGGQWLRIHFTDNGGVPLARRRASDCTRFRCAFQRTMLHGAYSANLGELQHTVHKLAPVAILREGHRIIPPTTTEPWIAGFCPSFAAAKERLEGQIDTLGHVLQDLGMGSIQKGMCGFPWRQQTLRCKIRDRALFLFPRLLTHFERSVVDPTTCLKALFKGLLLCMCRTETVFHDFSHGTNCSILGRKYLLPNHAFTHLGTPPLADADRTEDRPEGSGPSPYIPNLNGLGFTGWRR